MEYIHKSLCYACLLIINIILSATNVIATRDNRCPSVKPINHLENSQLMGQWYLAAIYPENEVINIKENCLDMKISPVLNETLRFIVTGYLTEFGAFLRNTEIGDNNENSNGVFTMKTVIGKRENYVPNIVLNIDPYSYVLLYQCINGKQRIWLLTRSQTPPLFVFESSNRTLAKQNIFLTVKKTRIICEWKAL